MEELIGAGLGSLVSLYNADKEREYKREQDEKRRRYLEYANTQAQNQYNNMMDLLDEYDANRMKYATPEMQQEFMDLVNSYNPSDYVYDFDKFNYDKSVDDFIDPNAQKISEMAGLQTQADATAGGAAGGTGALANMGYSRWQAASDLYKQAKQDLMNDRQQAYREYSDYIGNMQNKLNAMSTQQMGKINLLGGNIDKEQQLNSDYMSDLLGIMGDKAQTQINTTMGAF
jgi:gas vesicle protein